MKQIIFSLILFISISPAFAQDAEKSANREERRNAVNLAQFTADLDENEKAHFNTIYANYMLVNTVKTVQDDVSNAIKACGDNNVDMKGDLDARLAEWNSAVNPVMDEARVNINNKVIAQDYASQDQFDAIFQSVDDTREKTHNSIEKIPVTTPEACQYLMDKMDQTQKTMVALLRQTLVSKPIDSKTDSTDE